MLRRVAGVRWRGFSRPRDPGLRPRRRPVVLILVYGACLILVGTTMVAQAAVITADFQTTTLASIVDTDAALVRTVANTFVRPGDLAPGGPADARVAELTRTLAAMNGRAGIVRSELRTLDGRVVASDVPLGPGTGAPRDEPMLTAAAGHATASLVDAGEAGTAGPPPAAPRLIREDLPLVATDGSTVRGVIVVWRDAGPILAAVDAARREVVLLTLTAAVILSGVLYFVFKTAQQRITRQAHALVDATQRDALTGLLNHGALVDALAARIESARGGGTTLAVALVDIDGFRLRNDTLGHEVGDHALAQVAALLNARVPPGGLVGRYGPDEFLAIVPGSSSALASVIEALQDELPAEARETTGERLPITVSAGICQYPADAASATALLALAAGTLGEAKLSGGGSVRVAHPELQLDEPRGFDVLRGLVIAIDTKDRYTKRHSEDVARYALFIADQLGLDAELHRIIRLAGLLHDVGKIGIPDHILRKPGRLTATEQEIVKQHVALGDLIVGALPELELARAGVRHHHERWDGHGYLDGLAGEGIPYVARILAVADAFSAMTTSRPYRKALGIEEAITRLEDGAGTQFDERLLVAFVTGLRTAPDAPLPGTPATPLWTSERAA